MKTLAANILIMAFTLTLSCVREEGGTITGEIKEPYFSRPIRGVVVTIPDLKQSTLTDSCGVFSFRNLAPGHYKLAFKDTLRLIRYGFPSNETAEVYHDSTFHITIIAKALFDEIWKPRPYSLPFAKKGVEFFTGNHLSDPSGTPPEPVRLLVEHRTKRFISSLNEFQGEVDITSPSQALAFVRLLTTPGVMFEFNEMGHFYWEAATFDKRTYIRIPATEFTRLKLRRARAFRVSDSSYTVDRFIFAFDKSVFHILENVTRTGSYKIALKDSIGVLRGVWIPVYL